MRQMENLRSSVYEVVLERLNRIFSDFDNVYVSFTGGKDSWQKRIVARWQGNGAASEVSDGIRCFDRFGYGNAG